jgi:hypothetical protein
MTQKHNFLFIFSSLLLIVYTTQASEDTMGRVTNKPLNYDALHNLHPQDLKKMMCAYAHQPEHLEEILLRQKRRVIASVIDWPVDLSRNTLLHLAIKKNQPYFEQLFVKYGASIHAKNNQNETPLSLAYERHRIVMKKWAE